LNLEVGSSDERKAQSSKDPHEKSLANPNTTPTNTAFGTVNAEGK